jgi:hypothetical protein
MGGLAPRVAFASVILASLVASTPASHAYEPLFVVNSPPGILTGLAYGANPPPGVYFINFGYGGESRISGKGGSFGFDGFKVSSFHEAGAVIWSTPWRVLGASWTIVGVFGMVHGTLFDPNDRIAARITGLVNPAFSPMSLSWDVGNGFFAKAGVFIWAPFGTLERGPYNNGIGNIGFPYWTIEPHFALSYLADGWDLTAALVYGISTGNPYSGVTNGNSLNIDLTATKKFGQFELGPIGYVSTQVTEDSGCEAFYGPGVCAHGTKAGVGGLIGYHAGAVTLKLSVTNSVYTNNSLDGWRVWTKVSAPLWVPPPAEARDR